MHMHIPEVINNLKLKLKLNLKYIYKKRNIQLKREIIYIYYIQSDGVAMGSPLGPTLANVFLCYWKMPKKVRTYIL